MLNLRSSAGKAVLLGILASAAPATANPPAHHTETGRFTNPYVEQSNGGVFAFLKRRLFGKDDWSDYDRHRDGSVPTAAPRLVNDGEQTNNARVTWVGHATVLIQHAGVNVLTDPILSRVASPVAFAGPGRKSAPGVDAQGLPPIDVVVISHDHYDHLDEPTIRFLGDRPRYFVPLGLKQWLVDAGIDPSRVVELDWWEEQTVDPGGSALKVTATPTQHVSGRTLTDRNKRLWAGWAMEWDDFTVWFGGDTGYNDVQFKDIGDRFDGFDLGIIPIGSYAPRAYMHNYHADPEQAVRIHQDIRARRSMAVHWGAFHLTAEPLLEPPELLRAAVREAGLPSEEISAYAVGESRAYFPF
ncbi:MAG: MBL fold metallo-hydrolase [Pseudomonadales bacterium]|nr:MBL fold metallo-hydrolase [Pseudomonadales bacterium]NIX07484.1 MBL fold metallo-hydrolase [Pseudomonadales bacterium]